MRKQTVFSVSLGMALLTTGCQIFDYGGDVPAFITSPDEESPLTMRAALAAHKEFVP